MKTGVPFSSTPSPRTTDKSDVNETLILYYLAGKKWKDEEAYNTFIDKIQKLSKEQYTSVKYKSKAMALGFEDWAQKNNYRHIDNVWWTARPEKLAAVTGLPVHQNENPSDLLVKFKNGGFLGLSAKCLENSRFTTFKNLSIGMISKHFGFPLEEEFKVFEQEGIKKFSLPDTMIERKAVIKSNINLRNEVHEYGKFVLTELNKSFYDCISSVADYEVKDFIMDYVLNSRSNIPYVRVTGYKEDSVWVEDPSENSNIQNISFKMAEKESNPTVIFYNNGERVCGIRWKWVSGALYTGMKIIAHH